MTDLHSPETQILRFRRRVLFAGDRAPYPASMRQPRSTVADLESEFAL